MNGKRILVTGGTGFIGSNVANTLVEDNEVIALDDGSYGSRDHLHRDVSYVEADVREDELPTDVDHVVHLAALSSYGMHKNRPVEGASVNVSGFVNVIEQARRDGCDSVAYASSSSVYGSGIEPSHESDPVVANTAYEASKLAREHYASCYSRQYGMSLAGLRFFSVYQGYGKHESHKQQFANVIAQFAEDLSTGNPPELYGDGTQTRDFTHVDDVVRGIASSLEYELNGVFNVGTGRATDFNTLVGMLNEEMGTDIEPEHVPNPIPEDVYVHHTCASYEKLQRATGWEPRIDLETGISRVCDQYIEA